MLFGGGIEQLLAPVKSIDQAMHFYIEWGRFDLHNPDENWDMRKVAKIIHDELKSVDPFVVRGGRVNDSTDWSSWQYRFDEMLKFPSHE